MVSALSSSMSGMLANQRALDISANNTANVSTDGFRPARAAFSEMPGGGVQARAEPSSPNGAATGSAGYPGSGTDLAKEAVSALTYRIGFEMNGKVLKTADQMLGSLLDTKA